jgi:hypothetical protein
MTERREQMSEAFECAMPKPQAESKRNFENGHRHTQKNTDITKKLLIRWWVKRTLQQFNLKFI